MKASPILKSVLAWFLSRFNLYYLPKSGVHVRITIVDGKIRHSVDGYPENVPIKITHILEGFCTMKQSYNGGKTWKNLDAYSIHTLDRRFVND